VSRPALELRGPREVEQLRRERLQPDHVFDDHVDPASVRGPLRKLLGQELSMTLGGSHRVTNLVR